MLSEQLNPLALAVALDCGFAARSFAGDVTHLKGIMKEAVRHKGFALVDILQPCVTFNKTNTYDWYKQRVYPLEAGYDPEDRAAAFTRALEWGDRIPIGVLYRNRRPPYEDRVPVIAGRPLLRQNEIDLSRIAAAIKEFF